MYVAAQNERQAVPFYLGRKDGVFHYTKLFRKSTTKTPSFLSLRAWIHPGPTVKLQYTQVAGILQIILRTAGSLFLRPCQQFENVLPYTGTTSLRTRVECPPLLAKFTAPNNGHVSWFIHMFNQLFIYLTVCLDGFSLAKMFYKTKSAEASLVQCKIFY